jgi:hypothetical protein
MVCFMPDAQVLEKSIRPEADFGPLPRFTDAAIERAKQVLGLADVEKIGAELGYSRAGWYRTRNGQLDPRLSDARRIAARLGMTVDEVFTGGRDV